MHNLGAMHRRIAADNPDDLIGSAEATELLNIDRSTLTRWTHAGRITPATSLPGRTGARLYRRGDVEQLADELAGIEVAS